MLKLINKLEYLPKKFSVSKNLDIISVDTLQYFSKELTVDGNVTVKDCLKLQQIEGSIKVKGKLTLQDLGVEFINSNMIVKDSITIEGLDNLSYIDGFWQVSNLINIQKAKQLISINGKWQGVNKDNKLDITIDFCSNLTSMDVSIDASTMWVTHAYELYQISGQLNIANELYILHCPSLTKFLTNKELSIINVLYLSDCNSLVELSKSMRIISSLSIGCDVLENIPSEIFELSDSKLFTAKLSSKSKQLLYNLINQKSEKAEHLPILDTLIRSLELK